MRKHISAGFGVLAMLFATQAFAQGDSCAAVPQIMPRNAAILAPVSADLVSPAEQMINTGGVLSRAYSEALPVDQILLRMQIDRCRAAALAAMPVIPSANDPAAYQPRTAYDNKPWRFDMVQDGRRMTADEFTAWLESRGLRVAGGVPKTAETQAAEAPAQSAPTE